MTDRERLAKMMQDAYQPGMIMDRWTGLADALLAAGVTLPPEPPPLVTEGMLADAACIPFTDGTFYSISLDKANALVESAIRRAVERKTYQEMRDFCERLSAAYSRAEGWKPVTDEVLKFIGLVPS